MFDLSPIPDALVKGGVLSAVALVWIIVLVNVVGLRSFSKMTSFDFVITVAFGSLLATAATVSEWPAFVQALCAIGALFVVQYILAKIRKQSSQLEEFIGNSPVLLMRDGKVLEHELKRTRVTRSDLIAKLREANVMHFDEVRAVVLESTGDISVLHGDVLNEALLEFVECND